MVGLSTRKAERGARRRRPTIKELGTRCACCDFPLSQKHHLLPFADWGEVDITVQLCPNCHAIYHLIDKAGDDTPSSQSPAGQKVAWALLYRYKQRRPDDYTWLRGLWARVGNVLCGYEQEGHASREAWNAVELWAKRQEKVE